MAMDMRRGAVLAGVAAGHIGLLWWAAHGRAAQPVTPPEPVMMATLLAPAQERPSTPAPTPIPPSPQVQPPVPEQKVEPKPAPTPKPTPRLPEPVAAPTPMPVSPTPSPIPAPSPAAAVAPSPASAVSAPAPASTAVASAVPSPTPAASADSPLALPRSDAAYLNNPKPAYPPLSRKLEEEGNVVLSVYIQADGNPGEIKLKRSSGYPRLDQAALDVVKRWRFVPAKRGGEAIPYLYELLIGFSLKD